MNKSKKIQAESDKIVKEYSNAATTQNYRGESKPNPIQFILKPIMPELFTEDGKFNWFWAITNIGKIAARIKALWAIFKQTQTESK